MNKQKKHTVTTTISNMHIKESKRTASGDDNKNVATFNWVISKRAKQSKAKPSQVCLPGI